MPDPATQHYQGESGRHYHEIKRGIPPATFDWVARLRAEKFAPHVRPDDVVLEFGVGHGWNLAALRCRRRIGYDIAESVGPALAAHGIEFIRDLRPLPDASIDAILCHHALEHTLHPATELAEMRRLLKPSGRLVLCVPYEKERRYRHFNPAEPNHHLYSWNVQTLGNLVTDCGFAVLSGRRVRFRFDRFAAVWAHRLHLGERGFRCLRAALLAIDPEFEVQVIARRADGKTSTTETR